MSTPRYSIFISITMTTGIVVRSMKPKIEMPKQPNERKRKKGEKYGFVWYSLAPNIVYTHSMCIFAQSLYAVCGSHLVFGICVFYSMVQRMLNAGCLYAFCPSSFLAETLTTAAPKLLPYHLPFRMRMVNGESQMRNVNFCLRKCTVYTHNMKKHTQKKNNVRRVHDRKTHYVRLFNPRIHLAWTLFCQIIFFDSVFSFTSSLK